MMTSPSKQRLILCGGLQSGGTTLISWCFLQRPDTNGVLDMENDLIHASFQRVAEPIVWVKMTIGAFRWLDVCETYRDLGWNPEPFLVVRDVQSAYASLRTRDYGFNGLTAEEPPLRMRFRRFLMDWQLFRKRGWPVIKFEDFVHNPKTVLQSACASLRIPFDESMLSWPKKLSDISYVLAQPNQTFAANIGKGSLQDALLREKSDTSSTSLPESEVAWLQETFAEYNAVHGYRPSVCETTDTFVQPPRFHGTTRQWIYDENERLTRENEELRRQLLLRLDIEPVIPPETRFILVDKGTEIADSEGRESMPFPEHDGQWGGYPADDAAAIAELERLRQADAAFIVFPARMFYWLYHYTGLRDHLRATARCVAENDRVVIYCLREPKPSPKTRRSVQPVTTALRTVGLFLGPYRNLTTLVASVLHLHPACQVLNHAGERILGDESINFLTDYSDAKFDRFREFALTASQGGSRGWQGGSITFSHAFDHSDVSKAYRSRYGDLLVKDRIESIVWKESLLVARFLREHHIDIAVLLQANDKLRFLMPIRNPLDCAESNLRTGHASLLQTHNGHDLESVLEAILEEFAWVRDLSRQHPDRFLSFFEFEFDEALLFRLCRFLELEPEERWLRDALHCLQLKQGYEHHESLVDHYRSRVGELFAQDPEFAGKLVQFVAAR